GVMWLGDRPIPGSADAVVKLDEAGHTVAFCTNNSSLRLDAYVSKLVDFGVAERIAVNTISSATAAGSLIKPGERVLLCAGEGAREAVEDAGGELVWRAEEADTVIVGFHRSFNYDAMLVATRAVLGGARLLATNDDPIYPASDGPAPGGGAILAAIVTASRVQPVIAGKPHETMAALIRTRFGHTGVFVGDSLATDGAMAATLGWPFGLVLSGNITESDEPWQAADLAGLAERWLAEQ
ncbi:MAG: HAD hydrolase-like protein, partial [Actinobacteria bacterium]|nr:HAD hydrolase-like protein [Actinomycetota bacterium]